ncbi:MAG: hypothetical protein IK126_02575 [Bacteroidales bacterium]|nr:hypothetical protein [Bacteroidales bacterium]
MKKLVLILALMMATITVKANNILYFTYNQAARTVACLNSQDELMIYCGYEDELPTYVLINEVWAEQISSSFYEIWLYGYDAYTGEEIYMPIDLECIYLVQYGKIYSAAQYLRFRTTHIRPTFAWAMPPYNPFVRAPRPKVYYYTYHYDIHRPGWHWRNYPHIHYHPYYLRHPHHPAPMPPKPYTPGRERPGYHSTQNGYQYDDLPLVGNVTAPRSTTSVQNNPTGRSGSRITSDRKTNTITNTDRTTGRSTTTTAPSRSESLSGSGTRGNNISSRSGDSQDNPASRSGSSSTRGNSNSSRGGNDSGTSSSRSGNNSGVSPSRSGNNSSRGNVSSESQIEKETRSTSGTEVRGNNSSTQRGNSSNNKNSRSTGVSSNTGTSRETPTATRGSNNSTTNNRATGTTTRTNSSRQATTTTRSGSTAETPSRSGVSSSSREEQSSTRSNASRSGNTGRNR